MKTLFKGALMTLVVGIALAGIFTAVPAAADTLALASGFGHLVTGNTGDLSMLAIGIGMTTLAADKQRAFELGEQNDCPVIAADIIYENAAVGDNASGYARPLVAGDKFLGFALQRADNAAGSAGDINVRVRTSGRVQLSVSTAAITDVGKAVYASDDDTFTFTASGNSYIGTVVRYVSSGVVIVQFDAARGSLAASGLSLLTLSSTSGQATGGTQSGTLGSSAFSTALGETLNALAFRVNLLLQQVK